MISDARSFTVFLLAALTLAVIPGPGVLYVMARTIAGGRTEGIASALGTALGGLFHVFLAALGLSSLLAASAQAFVAIKYAGAAYLVFVGIRTLLNSQSMQLPTVGAISQVNKRRAFTDGCITETLNIKTALFFLAFIPQFVNHVQPAAPQFVMLGLICTALNTGVDLLMVLIAGQLLPYLKSSPKPTHWMSWGSGTVLLGLGAYVALSDSKTFEEEYNK